MSYNGYRNWETWVFTQYFDYDIYEILREQQEINYSTIYETIKYIINEMRNSIDKVEYSHQFIKDLVSLSLDEIDIKEVADTIAEMINENE